MRQGASTCDGHNHIGGSVENGPVQSPSKERSTVVSLETKSQKYFEHTRKGKLGSKIELQSRQALAARMGTSIFDGQKLVRSQYG